jgi:hypothetical protein
MSTTSSAADKQGFSTEARVVIRLLVWPVGIYWLMRRAGVKSKPYAILGSLVGTILLISLIGSAIGGSSTSTTTSTHVYTYASSPSVTAPHTTPAAVPPAPKPTIPQSEKDARAWITDLGVDANKVQANLSVVQIAVGLAIKNSSVSNVDKLAQYAQQAHDNLDSIRQDFANTNTDSGAVGDAELAAFSGANDLKNSMGALVAYTGDPNPATLASFTTQYKKARGEWNYGVRTIWRMAHKQHPPTV